MFEYAGQLISRFQIGKYGKTALARSRGRSPKRPMAEFGESVHYKPLKDNSKTNKLDTMWHDGVWIGINGRTEEAIIGTENGIIKARAIKRKPSDEKFQWSDIEKIKGLPWAPVPGREGYGIPTKIDIKLPEHKIDKPEMQEELIIRRMRITRKDVEEHGTTSGCPGCKAVRYGKTACAHSEECRRRIESHIVSSEKGKERIQR